MMVSQSGYLCPAPLGSATLHWLDRTGADGMTRIALPWGMG
jgi:hypothetical protein